MKIIQIIRQLGIISILLILPVIVYNQTSSFEGETIEFSSLDNLEITADLYLTNDLAAPFILLFHQAGWSRGSYREIAPKLNALGFNCLAIDQRSGKGVNDIINETAKRAKSLNMPSNYTDAFPDLQAALNFVQNEYKPKTTIIWGSSYSAALVFILAEKNPDVIDGLLSFSPGEYFTFEGKGIPEFAKSLNIPVFITSAKAEQKNWQGIFKVIPSSQKVNYIPDFEGYHGSRALWEEHEGYEKYWEQVKIFLKKFH